MALQASDITVRKTDATLLKSVSLRVEPGEVLGILGPNGAGKSTLLRAISGEERPSEGSVRYDESDIYTLSVAQMAKVRALVPQSSVTPFNFTVRDMLELGVDPSHAGQANELIAEIADELDLPHLLGRTVSHLSGGENQRMRIGRAMLQLRTTKARYILLDEPTSAQDPGRSTILADLMRKFARERGIGILVIVHDLNLAARLCDRLVLLKSGQILAQGTASEVYTSEILNAAFGEGLEVYHKAGYPPIVLPSLATA